MTGNPTTRAVLETGIPNLDAILGGGLPHGDMVLAFGPAGSGKTTLALQLAFHVARRGGTALFVSTYSEPPARLVRHIRPFSFYDESVVGKRVVLLDVYPVIQQDLRAVVRALIRATADHAANLVIIDGMMTLHEFHTAPGAVRTFLYELGTALEGMSCTTLLTGSQADISEGERFPELTLSDVVLQLGTRDIGVHSVRTLRVHKARGRSPRLGSHAIRLDEHGLAVYPRIESIPLPPASAPPPGRVPLGLPELDAMMRGGPPAGSTTLLAGALGTGKTLTCLQFLLDGGRDGDRGIFVAFRESELELIEKARSFGLDLEGEIRRGRIVVIRRPPVDVSADELAHEILGAIERASPGRLVLDSIFELELSLAEQRRGRAYLSSLALQLRSRAITSIITKELPHVIGPELDFSDTPIEALADNLLLMRYVELRGDLYRILSVLRMTGSDCDRTIRQYIISDAGLRVLPTRESAKGLLSGIARLGSEQRVKRPGPRSVTRGGPADADPRSTSKR